MKRLAIVLMVFLGLVVGHMYWFGIASNGTSDECANAPDKFECSVRRAAIEEERRKCTAACGSKKSWNGYCDDGGKRCKSDCQFERNAATCRSICDQEIPKCKASYRDPAQCRGMCSQIYK